LLKVKNSVVQVLFGHSHFLAKSQVCFWRQPILTKLQVLFGHKYLMAKHEYCFDSVTNP